MKPVVTCIQAANAVVGEGPSWDHNESVLYWVDIKRPALFRWDPKHGQTGHWPMPKPIGCVSPAQGGQVVFADSDGFGLLELLSGKISRIAAPKHEPAHNRFNDGKVDRAGRFWAGTMDDNCIQPTGSLYRLDTDFSLRQMDTGFTCSNGLGWSLDNRIMYFTDSMARTIWAYEFDLDRGELGTRRIFARLTTDDGVPDGLTVDSEGFIWSSIWDGWRLIRYAPDGTIDQEVPMPVQRPSSCIFGGEGLKTLYVTSATADLNAQSLQKGPLAGALFSVQLDIAGVPEVAFGGYGE